MRCHECGRQVAVGDRFCTGCGVSLDGVTEPTRPIATTVDTDHAAPTAPEPAAARGDTSLTDQLPRTESIDEVWDEDPMWAPSGPVPVVEPVPSYGEATFDPTSSTAATTAATATATATATTTVAMPATPTFDPAWTPPASATAHRFRFTAVTVIGAIGGVLALVAMFLTIVEITSSAPLTIGPEAPTGFRTGIWIADDLGDNLSIAGLLAALAMVVGAVGAAFGRRWGAGLAGGGGLAMTGLAALIVGLAQYPIDAAHAFAEIPAETPFTLTITRDLGYWLVIVAGAIGVVAFFASMNEAVGDRGGLNPWIAALGALAALAAAIGPMIPEGSAVFSDNWYVIPRPGEPPAMLVAMRLVQLGTLALGGVIGFLSVRRWGLGVAAGVSAPVIWLAVSTLFELGDRPVGPGYRNPGATSTELHGVTIIGVSALLALLVLAIVAAYDQSTRRH